MPRVDDLVRERARALGFDKVGVASAKESLEPEYSRYEAFIARGMHGTMDYLATPLEARKRADTAAILEGAASVICVAEGYGGKGEAASKRPHEPDARDADPSPSEHRAEKEGVAGYLARYARGSDYHNHLRRRLRRLAAFVRGLGPGVQARPVTDAVPMLERAWASRAGLGFVGKNGLIITPGLGSFVLLGEVVTTLELTPGVPLTERCGSCSLCLDACPTGAFERPFVLDPRRCVSYLTIELRGPMPPELRADVGEHLFGCDECQEVCPYNRAGEAKPSGEPPDPGSLPRARFSRYQPLPRWGEATLEDLALLDLPGFHALVRGSAVKRATYAGLVRNAVTVLANRRDPRYKDLLEMLAREHPDLAVREHAAWGLTLLDAPCDG
jgi:epoxyqueuosine reductase